MLRQVVIDRVLQVAHAGVTASANALCGDLCEEALDKVEPRGASWCEMQLETRMFLQPGLHLGRLVGGVVVEHELDVTRFADGAVNPAQEGQKLPCPVTRHAITDDQTGFDIKRGEQGGRAVAFVIMGHRGGAPLLERQARLGPIKCLDL